MKFFTKLSKIGQALMTPIAILPAAGIFLAVGTHLELSLMTEAGGVIFNNLPLLFAVGVAIGLADGDGVAGLAGIVAMLIMNTTIGHLTNAKVGLAASDPAFALVLGTATLQTGVLGGLIAGIIGAVTYNKFYNTKLPEYLGFFAGKRLVPIIAALVGFMVGIIIPWIWQPIQGALTILSQIANDPDKINFSLFIYGLIDRALIPFGLHHIFYSPFWFQFGEYTNTAGEVINGDYSIWFAMLSDGIKTFNSDTYIGAGKFMTGKFPVMMFGLPAAALAMYHEAKPNNKKFVGGILFSAALTTFITGITEPIEFTFLFVAPVLFGLHCIFAGASFVAMNTLNVRVGTTFSGGVIDYTILGVLPGLKGFKTNYPIIILIGFIFALVYYFCFRFFIRKFNLKTLGREEIKEVFEVDESQLAYLILNALGGKDNILSIGSCITRLRVEVKDTNKVNHSEFKKLGASGLLKVGQNGVQAIFGAKAQFISNDIKKIIEPTSSF